MPALAATDVTVTIPAAYGMRIDGSGRRHVAGTLTFGNGALTYPTAGVPLPAVGAFGMRVTMQQLHIYGNNARTVDYMPRYNKAAHKLLLYEEEATAAGGPLLECDIAEAPAAVTYDFEAVGW
jgi:hypothetical protein